MTAAFAVETHDLDAIARLRGAWRDLADRALEPNVFAEPAFLLAAARHLARAPPRFLTIWHSAAKGARLVGLCPLADKRWPGPFPARVWSHPQATAAFPLLDRDEGPAALAALLAAIGQGRGRPGGLVMAGLALDGATAAAARDAGASPCWIDPRRRAVLLRGRAAVGPSSSGRKELRRQWNRLADQGDVRFASARESAAVASALDRFLGLEAKGWKGRRGTALGSTAGTCAFARTAIGELAAAGRCRIDSLDLEGRPLAMGIVLNSGDRGFFWKTAYDEDFARFSPGLQLASRLTALQLEDPLVAATDSCAIPGHGMIDRLWPDRWQVADCLVATGAVSATGLARLCAIERTRRRLRSRAQGMARVLRLR